MEFESGKTGIVPDKNLPRLRFIHLGETEKRIRNPSDEGKTPNFNNNHNQCFIVFQFLISLLMSVRS